MTATKVNKIEKANAEFVYRKSVKGNIKGLSK